MVEDDAAISEAICMVIEGEGYSCVVVNKAKKVLPTISKFSPNLIVMDLLLPDGNGIQIAEEIRRRGLATSIVMVTARASAKRVLKSGLANAFLEKPYEMSDLIEVVNKEIK
ncbi:MAG: Two component system response regulator [Microgenomates group bacterium GW2011_GWC1_43_13]|nr:MAG: Two component system response regulator [Microgenomates group bacterium GW2011_GWC1_43_13]